ncbi:MAG: thiamine pyrophosphate-binding protein [Myxococcota bacterium]|nr:thiamine pyrophosphate-binding protein [Myxococcota bacterium]
MSRRLMEGSEAIAEAAIAAGCRFFAGYPMTPFTELLENFAAKLPGEGGVCINAESELEAVGMAWGAAATGARAATGSTGQGLALMQESLSELSRAELPLVVFNMSRGQSDYYQATRGGGHGDYRQLVLAPIDSAEAVELTQLAFHLADRWRNPVLLYGDYLLAHTAEAVAVEPRDFGELSAKDWAVDGSLGGSGRSRNLNPLGMQKGSKGLDPEAFWRRLQAKWDELAREEARLDHEFCEDAELVVVAFGSLARFARFAVHELRAEGMRVGFARPITLWPFPSELLAQVTASAQRVAVLEQNAGQMIDDVRLSILGRVPVVPIGGISSDEAGFGLGPLLDPEGIRSRVAAAHAGEEVAT